VTAKWITITPEEAQFWLQKNPHNREIRPKDVAWLAKALKEGTFNGDIGEPIRITSDGRLLDGQHRLSAVVEAGLSIETWIIIGVPMILGIRSGTKQNEPHT